MKSSILIILGLIFALNIFLRVRLTKLFKQVNQHQLRIGWRELISGNQFDRLITDKYPEHKALLVKYRKNMLSGFVMLILVVLLVIIVLST